MERRRRNLLFSSALDLLARRRTSYMMARAGLAFVAVPLNLFILSNLGVAPAGSVPVSLVAAVSAALAGTGIVLLSYGIYRHRECKRGLDELACRDEGLRGVIYHRN